MSEVRTSRPVFFLSSWHVAWSVDILYSSIFIQMHFLWMLLLYQCFNDHDSDQHIVQILIFMSIERIWYGIMGYMIDVTLLRYFSLLYPYPHLSMWNMISWIYYFSARLCTEYFPPSPGRRRHQDISGGGAARSPSVKKWQAAAEAVHHFPTFTSILSI